MELNLVAETWKSFKETGDIRLRNELVVHYQPLLNQVAARVGKGLPSHVEREDLVSYGVFGVIDAIEKFDIDKGVKFETYAVSRIRGSIIDHLRNLDWVPRSVRTKAKDLDSARNALELELGREPDNIELAKHMSISMEELWELQSTASPLPGSIWSYDQDADRDNVTTITLPTDVSANSEQLFETREMSERISSVIASMGERSKTIITLYYIEEMTLSEIGKLLGVTESRVCQLQSRILQGLHESLVMRESVSA